ncbi:SMP-30/gluconolactonase/LRE family protein [Coralloluteibacterium stylophorae]|uniref:SMP-30/gluconolactonase/LRE family protein n=2 Tax=Coralloluteibacterium stylophorae TaxID=1776034 RepID=A0A8J7VQV3_9GAMM|nr:L-dopachrome tautomerase-related protein [Coralloluteibacterium stylophorae]MBS7456955.1 SMP-30/gluconolactonase/LRE family protein [Coralloluteibacterium stylophorae]
MIRIASAVALAMASASLAAAPPRPAPADLPAEDAVGALEQVAAFDGPMPTGVAVSETGRIFVNFPRWGDAVDFTVAELVDGRAVAYPDVQRNRAVAGDPAAGFISVQSVVADGRGHLWVLDTAAPGFAAPLPGGAKLVEIDLAGDRVLRTLPFPADVMRPRSYVNDVRFDFRAGEGGVAYVTDSSLSGRGAIIVMDLARGTALRRLDGHRSTSADPGFVPIVEGRRMQARGADGVVHAFTVASDGIALSPDGATLYFSPLSSRHLYAVPTALLRDAAVDEATLAAAVRDLGEKGASDGLEADAGGAVYASDYEHNAIHRRDVDGSWHTIAHDPRMLWPDSLAIGPDGWLYFTANQLHRQPGFQGGSDLRRRPYSLFRVRIDAAPAPTH